MEGEGAFDQSHAVALSNTASSHESASTCVDDEELVAWPGHSSELTDSLLTEGAGARRPQPANEAPRLKATGTPVGRSERTTRE